MKVQEGLEDSVTRSGETSIDGIKWAARFILESIDDPYRIDETYIKVKGKWKYLYRAVDSRGNTIDFLLNFYTQAFISVQYSTVGGAARRGSLCLCD